MISASTRSDRPGRRRHRGLWEPRGDTTSDQGRQRRLPGGSDPPKVAKHFVDAEMSTSEQLSHPDPGESAVNEPRAGGAGTVSSSGSFSIKTTACSAVCPPQTADAWFHPWGGRPGSERGGGTAHVGVWAFAGLHDVSTVSPLGHDDMRAQRASCGSTDGAKGLLGDGLLPKVAERTDGGWRNWALEGLSEDTAELPQQGSFSLCRGDRRQGTGDRGPLPHCRLQDRSTSTETGPWDAHARNVTPASRRRLSGGATWPSDSTPTPQGHCGQGPLQISLVLGSPVCSTARLTRKGLGGRRRAPRRGAA